MTDIPLNVLFLCTGNSARSVIAECLLNHFGRGRFRAFSAGSRPTGAVNPFAIEILKAEGVPASGLRSKSWDEFGAGDSPRMDIVITVCGNAAAETCPVWPGAPISAHWGFDDPAAAGGSDDARRAEFRRVFGEIREKVHAFVETAGNTPDTARLGALLRDPAAR